MPSVHSHMLIVPSVCFYLLLSHPSLHSRRTPTEGHLCCLTLDPKHHFSFPAAPSVLLYHILQNTVTFTVFHLAPPLDDLPKPQITVQPETTVTVLGSDVRLTCTAASSSSSPMTFAWRKDQELLRHAEMENYAHVRAYHQGATSDAPGAGGGVMEYTTILHLRHVTFAHEGRYQCIITNHFGSTYSSKARLIVNGM